MVVRWILCPFHYVELVKVGRLWICPVRGCLYSRISCPYCGFVIRILPSGSYCLRCRAKFSFETVVRLYAMAYNISIEKARKEVRIIMNRYVITG